MIRTKLLILILLLSTLSFATSALAQPPFVVSNPTGSSIWETGSTYTVTWTGGDALWFVNVSLVDVPTWLVVDDIALNVPNSGSLSYTVPLSVTPSTYLVYVEDVNVTSWTYGEQFPINDGGVAVEAQTWSGIKALYD